jgi:beta-galactosidase
MDIAIGVIPVKYAGQKHSPSAWKMTNAMASWSWEGCENMKTRVEVYARAYEIELLLNGKTIGKKRTQNDCRVVFDVTYMPGELKAVAFAENGKVIATTALLTAGEKTQLVAEPELAAINCDGDLAYVRLKFTDQAGEVKPLERDHIKVSVTGGELIGLGSACPYYEGSYLDDVCDTYYGEALAVIRPVSKGSMVVNAVSLNKNLTAAATVEVR